MASFTQPLRWKDICQYDKCPPKVGLNRTIEIEEKYEKHKECLSASNIKIDEYINKKYFSGQNENKMFHFVCNTFPYNCTENIKHYLIWVNPKYNKFFPDSLNYSKFDPLVKKEVSHTFDDKSEFIFFENIMELKSVKSIRHIHIFIKSN